MLVYLDGPEESQVPDLALVAAEVLDGNWNGWARPLATAPAIGAFLDAWRSNDPNGIWGWATAVGHDLVVSRADSDEPADVFPAAGEDSDGAPLYDLTGWCWLPARG